MIDGMLGKFFCVTGGNSGLTEEFIYNNQPKNKEEFAYVFTGTSIENINIMKVDVNAKKSATKKIKVFSNEAIKIVRKGKAGCMQYINSLPFTVNDDVYIMSVKPQYMNLINLKYFLYTQSELVKDCITSDGEGKNGTFNKTLFEKKHIFLPDISKQNMVVSQYEKIINFRRILNRKIDGIEDLLAKTPKCNYGEFKTIDEVFNLISEDRKLTEEYIYTHQGEYPVYSAQINGAFGYIDSYSFEGDVLTVVQYGDSGKTVLRSGKLNIGRNCCGLIPKEKYKDKVNLHYLKYALEEIFVDNAKGTDLKSLSQDTINKTCFFLPDIQEQNLISVEYSRLERLKDKMKNIVELMEQEVGV